MLREKIISEWEEKQAQIKEEEFKIDSILNIERFRYIPDPEKYGNHHSINKFIRGRLMRA